MLEIDFVCLIFHATFITKIVVHFSENLIFFNLLFDYFSPNKIVCPMTMNRDHHINKFKRIIKNIRSVSTITQYIILMLISLV